MCLHPMTSGSKEHASELKVFFTSTSIVSKTPEKIAEQFHTVTLEQVYATILYYLHYQSKVDAYLADWLEFSRTMREQQQRKLSPALDKVSADAAGKHSKAVTRKLMAIRYLLDEHLNPAYRSQLVRRNPDLVVRIIGDLDVLLKDTPDPEILIWCKTNEFILVTNNRKSMPGHLADHLANSRHIPGIFTIDANQSIGQTVEELIIIAGASFKNEYQDRIEYLPLV
ncbi:MAG: DUF5615 family PIN-like protein [Rhizonema sp. PD38]|nr:DUF5615 family PIN-like protein [Rhizonema sp. PD38]